MNCGHSRDILSAYLENELTASEKRLVEEHLEICPDCAGLLGILRETREALRGFPEIEVGPALLTRLRAIPDKEKKPLFNLADFLKPAIQPFFAVAASFLMLFTIYTFHPNKKGIDQTVIRGLHQGYNTAEKLYAKAGSLVDELGSYKDTVLGSFKNLKIFGGQKKD